MFGENEKLKTTKSINKEIAKYWHKNMWNSLQMLKNN